MVLVDSKTYSASAIAKWFIDWANAEDAGLSNLKLQKLLYYAQGHHLVDQRSALFDDPIQAWSHGPVVPSVYDEYKEYGSDFITLPEDDLFNWEDIDPETTRFLNKVWNTYGPIAAWKLRNMTHDESPWRNHFDRDARDVVIPIDEIAAYFSSRDAR